MSGFGQPPGGGGGFGQPPGGGGFGPPDGGGYGAPPGAPMGQPGPAGYGGGPPSGPAPNFVLWIIFGFVTAFACMNMPFGVIGGILAVIAQSDWNQGNAAGAESKLKISKLLSIIGLALMGLGVIAYIVVMFLLVGASAAAGSY